MSRVGVTRTARHIPDQRMTALEIAELSGLSLERIRKETGMHAKPIGYPGETALDHALAAGKALLQDLDPATIDLLVYASASLADFPLWGGVYKLHHALGLSHARFLELNYGCVGSLHALELVRNYVAADPRINRAVVIGAEGYHFDDTLTDYANPANEPMYFFSDGAAAALLESERVAPLSNHLGRFAYRVDPERHAETPVPAGGAKAYTSSRTVSQNLHALQLPKLDVSTMRRFGVRYIRNYLAVIEESLAASERPSKPDFLICSQLKLPLLQILLDKLGLDKESTIYTMPYWGHMGTADILLSLGEALDQHKLKPGMTAAIVSSGVGFSWGAGSLIMV
jgi:3-oxoacyl-[acyl-carrier-protein] synthase-3